MEWTREEGFPFPSLNAASAGDHLLAIQLPIDGEFPKRNMDMTSAADSCLCAYLVTRKWSQFVCDLRQEGATAGRVQAREGKGKRLRRFAAVPGHFASLVAVLGSSP